MPDVAVLCGSGLRREVGTPSEAAQYNVSYPNMTAGMLPTAKVPSGSSNQSIYYSILPSISFLRPIQYIVMFTLPTNKQK